MIGGNIHNYLEEWEKITRIKTILNWIKEGVPLEFDSIPESYDQKNNILKRKEIEFLDSEIKKLVENGCISKCNVKPHCVSRIGTVPKKDG